MRIAIFVAIVAAHIALVWYFLTLRHLVESEDADESSMTLVFLAPTEWAPNPAVVSEPEKSAQRPGHNIRQAPLLYRKADDLPAREPAASGQVQQPPPPDWREAAEAVAQADAQHIVESEDRGARQAGALTAMIRPLPGPHVPGPSFHWDPNPRYHWQHVPSGGWVMPLNDHCDIGFFIMLWIGCSVGELPPARGDLFKNMHPPVKFGDWDWRVDDP